MNSGSNILKTGLLNLNEYQWIGFGLKWRRRLEKAFTKHVGGN
jgi:hypothetical protein